MSDTEAIQLLLARYVEAADEGRPRDFADLFAQDGVLEIDGADPVAGRYAGREAIFERMGAGREGRPAAWRHHVSSVRIEVDEPGVSARVGAYFLAVRADGPDHWGRYADRLVGGPQGWRFAHRHVTIDGSDARSFMRGATA